LLFAEYEERLRKLSVSINQHKMNIADLVKVISSTEDRLKALSLVQGELGRVLFDNF
jgi:hypothetical protein